MKEGRNRGRLTACIAGLAIAFCAAATAHADMPNDPGFAGCEKQDPVSGCTDSEQWDLFGPLQGNDCPAPLTGQPTLPHPDGGLPCWAPLATDPDHAAGVDMTGAWDQGNTGRDDVLVAYIEGGVNYSSDGIKDGLDNVYLNKGELPFPAGASKYDADGNGRFDIRDYAKDPRVNPPCPPGVAPFTKFEEGTTRSCVPGGQHQYLNRVTIAGAKKTPYLSPEDLIAVFGHCKISKGRLGKCPPGGRFDNDRNGYPNDVSGWNFQRNTNDPQTEDIAYNHAPGLISLIGGQANNNYAGVGVCRDCRVVPIKQGAECLGRTDKWGESILYATDLGALAISSVVVGFDYSSFNQKAIDYAYDHGVVLSLDSNDFDSMDHTDGMLWNHVMPGNSLAEDKGGPAANLTTYFRSRSNTTSYGTHNIFSGGEYTTSGATPFNASMYAMTAAAGLNARDKGVIGDRLNPNEIKQVLMDTASPVIPQTQTNTTVQQWPGNPDSHTDADHTNWSTQFGYGRPDLGRATKMIMDGHIPPTADLTSPRWFQYVDPVSQPKLEVDGALAPSRFHSGGSASYVLEYAAGADPKDSDFITAAQGTINGPKSGVLGQLDLTKLPPSFASHDPGSTLQPDGAEQYTVTIRLRVKDANGIKAEDRRSIGVRHDPSLMPGYPRYIGSEAGFGLTYTALEGRHELDLVFGTYDGMVQALRPNGTEVKGFPVHTSMLRALDPREPQNSRARAYRVRAFRDMRDPVAGIAVGDLFHDGREEVVASSTNGFVYAWGPNGKLLHGFPQHTDPAFWTLPVPTPRAATPHSRLPDRGNTAPPVLAPLEGGARLDIIQSSWDGHVYAWRPDGHAVPGWPVDVKLPQADFQRDGVDPSKFIHDPKLMYPVGVADVLHKGRPQVFVSSFDCNGESTSQENLGLALAGFNQSSGNAKTWMYGIWPDGNRHAGGAYLPKWPVAVPTLDFCYDQSIDFVGESTSPPEFADFDGSGNLRIVTAGVTGVVYVLNGDGSTFKTLDPSCTGPACQANPPYRPGDSHTLTLTAQGGLGDITGSGHPEFVQSQVGLESILSALSIPGLASLPQVYEKAWDLSTGSELAGFPRTQDGFTFYNSPIISDVAGDGTRQAIESNDNYWIHAYDSKGGEAPGFPKYTGQWPTFAGVVGDPKLDGQLHYVTVTREGYLFDWKVGGHASLNDQWWHYRHDERNTGLYGLDTRPPAPIAGLKLASVHAHGHGRRAARRLVLSFVAPGDDWNIGKALHYEVRFSKHRIVPTNLGRFRATRSAPAPAPAGTRQTFTVPRGLRGKVYYVAIRSIDDAGNISPTFVARLRLRRR